MTVKEAYVKLDNTLCLNSQRLKFSIDTEDHEDCNDIYDMVEALETLKKYIEINLGPVGEDSIYEANL